MPKNLDPSYPMYLDFWGDCLGQEKSHFTDLVFPPEMKKGTVNFLRKGHLSPTKGGGGLISTIVFTCLMQ